MKSKNILLALLATTLLVSIAFNLMQNRTITLKTQTNEELKAQISGVQEQINSIQENQTLSDDAVQKYMSEIENKYKGISDHYRNILSVQGKIIFDSNIDTSKYVHIYDIDANNMRKFVMYYLNIPENVCLPDIKEVEIDQLNQILSEIISAMSMDLFNYMPIEIMQLTQNETGFTAEINLSELPNSGEMQGYQGWNSFYFQGSTGGSVTEDRLIYTILQPEVSNWPITAVQFTYEGQKIEFDHVPSLYKIIERDSL